MDKRLINKISRRKFDARCYVRAPHIGYLFEEIDWFEAYQYKVISTLVIDTDGEFCYLILGRDKRNIYRTVGVPTKTYKTRGGASRAMKTALKKFEDDGKLVYEQGDEKGSPNEFLTPQVPEHKLHPYFKALSSPGHEAAKALINEIVYSFVDVDGNYIKDFQTTGFDGRLWELYLYVYLHRARFSFDNSFSSPDFLVNYFGQDFAIEAVTVNRGTVFQEDNPIDAGNAFLLCLDYMPIKFAGSLTAKLQKQYWQQQQVKGKPLILAIHDFHQASTIESLGSMTWSRNALINYIYGIKPKYEFPDEDHVRPLIRETKAGTSMDYEKVNHFIWKGKTVEAGFFDLPGAENISAILFSNNATITAFNRMGHLAGLSADTTKIFRAMDIYNPERGSIIPIRKVINIDDKDYEEDWGDSLVMYHNPHALLPVDINCFPDISHMFFDEQDLLISGYPVPFEVLNSMTVVLIPKSQ